MHSNSDKFRFYKVSPEYLLMKGLTDQADLRLEVSIVVFSQGVP